MEDLLRNNNLPRPLAPDELSGWMVPFAMQAQGICGSVGTSFVFLDSDEMQAVAVQDEEINVVGVYLGMFSMLCRLATVVASSGVFPAMKGDIEPSWNPDVERSMRSPRKLLEERRPFDWELESIGWKQAGERQMLFYVVLAILFRFVVFHEMGHIVNDHGRRRRIRTGDALLVDQPSPPLRDPGDAVPSQAREIIADGFAFLHTIKSFDDELSSGADFELAQIVRNQLAPDGPALIRFVVSVVFLYFRLSDRSDWLSSPIDCLTHPPAPFRMKALMALLFEEKPLGIDDATAAAIVSETTATGDALMSVMLHIFPQPDWIMQISTPAHDRHFGQIYEEIPNWLGSLPS
nr:hypothetical protein [uncultured Devosia sp.]